MRVIMSGLIGLPNLNHTPLDRALLLIRNLLLDKTPLLISPPSQSNPPALHPWLPQQRTDP